MTSSGLIGHARSATCAVLLGACNGSPAVTDAAGGDGTSGVDAMVDAASITDAAIDAAPAADNEPAGFTLITDRDWSALASCGQSATRIQGWDDIEACAANGSAIDDPTAPRSPARVYEWRYPAGYSAGSAPATAQRSVTSLGFKKLYISVYVQLSAGWEGHSSGTNKMFFVWHDGDPMFFLSAEGSGSGALAAQMRLQGTLPDTRPRLVPNVTFGATIARGTWQRWEVVLECTTAGAADGRARWWIDGQLVSDYQDIHWTEAGKSCVWENVQLRPVWGGTGGATTNAMSLRMDHIRISGSP